MSPLIRLLQAVRKLGIKPPLRKPALQNLRSAGKGYSQKNMEMADFHETSLDQIFEFMGSNRGAKAEEVEDILDLLTNMYMKGGGRY